MKHLLILSISLLSIFKPAAQVTNVKAGFWSDRTIWSNKAIPVYTDMIALNFDVVVDINATCKSLINNGYNVVVNSGATLSILGNGPLSIDTTVIFTKKSIFHINGTDSLIQVFSNNKINGIKGFVVKARFNQQTPTTSVFTYNNLGQLCKIVISEDALPSHAISTVILSWDKNSIVHIKWDEIGWYGMDRDYGYSVSNDTLLIRYKQNIGRDMYFDSATVTILADTGLNKIYSIFKGGLFDNKNNFFKAKGDFYNERKFEYADKNITSVKYFGQTNYTTTPYQYTVETDSSVCYFTREPQVNTFLAAFENDIFGKAFKMLCFDQTDSIALVFDQYFGVGNPSRQDYYQYGNVFNSTLDPITQSKINYAGRRDVLIFDQQTGYLYKKLVYTLDSSKRIASIKEYDVLTNNLNTEINFSYP